MNLRSPVASVFPKGYLGESALEERLVGMPQFCGLGNGSREYSMRNRPRNEHRRPN
jgi:hypothetical protein